MTTAATLEALDLSVIRNILRSMINEHWSVTEALDEYDIPDYGCPVKDLTTCSRSALLIKSF